MAEPHEYEPAPWHKPLDPNRDKVSGYYTVDGTQDFSKVGPEEFIVSGGPDARRQILLPAGEHLSANGRPLDLPEFDNGATTTLNGGQVMKLGGRVVDRVDYTVGPEPQPPAPPEQH